MMEEEMICDFRTLRELRKSHALSIVELSEQSGVSASVISKLERNQTKAELDTLSKPQLHSDDFETCWLRRGKLRIILPNETCLLEPGMSVQFDALLPHTYEVLEDCEVFIVHLKKGNRF